MTLSKYNEVMDNIKVSEEMRQRILGNIEKELGEGTLVQEADQAKDISQVTKGTEKTGSRRPINREKIIRFITFYGSRAAVFLLIAAGTYGVIRTVGLKDNHQMSAPSSTMYEAESAYDSAAETAEDYAEGASEDHIFGAPAVYEKDLEAPDMSLMDSEEDAEAAQTESVTDGALESEAQNGLLSSQGSNMAAENAAGSANKAAKAQDDAHASARNSDTAGLTGNNAGSNAGSSAATAKNGESNNNGSGAEQAVKEATDTSGSTVVTENSGVGNIDSNQKSAGDNANVNQGNTGDGSTGIQGNIGDGNSGNQGNTIDNNTGNQGDSGSSDGSSDDGINSGSDSGSGENGDSGSGGDSDSESDEDDNSGSDGGDNSGSDGDDNSESGEDGGSGSDGDGDSGSDGDSEPGDDGDGGEYISPDNMKSVDSASEISEKLGYDVEGISFLADNSSDVEYAYCSEGGEITYHSDYGTIHLYASDQGLFTVNSGSDIGDCGFMDEIDAGDKTIDAIGEEDKYTTLIWSSNGITYVLVSDKGLSEDLINKFF